MYTSPFLLYQSDPIVNAKYVKNIFKCNFDYDSNFEINIGGSEVEILTTTPVVDN